MKIIFRTDASLAIGHGHVKRCLTLANALREQGAAVSFVCREHDGHLCNLIAERGFAVSRLPAPKGGAQIEDVPAHAPWLEISWQKDAEQSLAAIESQGGKADWLVVDHYAIDQRWEDALRAYVEHIMVIDDLADRPHNCDLLLDQNLVGEMRTRYPGKVPPACSLLLGPEYALLEPVYAELHDRILPREGAIRRIFIFFGGVDSYNLTGRALAAFLQLNRPDIEVDVVITTASPHEETIRQQAAGHNNIRLHSGLLTLAPLMAKADLAIGAGGATTWERLCLGLPTLVVTVGENQRPIADELSQRGLIRWLGHQDLVDQTMIEKTLNDLISQGLGEDWSRHCLAAVDGNGVNRVCAALTVTANVILRVRYAKLEDEALLLTWANDSTTRRNSFSPENIPAPTHQIWFRNHLQNQDGCRLYIVETTDGVALGQVRFERQDQAWEVHYALAPVFRGRGLGRALLEVALQKFRADMRGVLIFGQVKSGNQPSRKIFESLGFETQPDIDVEEGIAVYRRML